MKEILIRVADKLPKVVSMTGTAVRDNRYRLTFEFDNEWQDGLKTYIIADSRGHFVPYPSEENHIDVELGGSHVINVGVMQDILATSRPCQIFLEESIRQKMKDEIPPPEPDVWTYITEQIRILATEKLSPVQKAEDMTQEVGVDPNGRLWTNPGSGGITQETDPTVPAWAKQKTKPSYTASEVGAFSEEAGSELGNYVYRLFLATYDQTTFAEIRSAHRRERHVLLRHPDIGTMPMAACTVEGAVFFTVNEFGTIRIAHVNINDDWYVKIIKPEMTENRENTLSNSATNYPSSYAVTQAIAALNTVSSLVFDTIEEMDQYIAEFGDRLKVGQSLYIRASDVPDYWWDGTAALPMESGGSGQPGADGFSPSASVEQTDDGAVITITDKDGTTSATITNGQDGQPGQDGEPGADGTSVTVTDVQESTEDGGSNVVTFSDGKTLNVRNGKTGAKGDPGNDYVLTEADKEEIAGMIPGGGSGGSAGVVIFSVLYTDEQASLLEAPVVYPTGADMDTLLAAGQVQMVMFTPSDSEDVPTKLGVLLPMNVDVGGQTIRFAGTITGKDGNEAVMAELHTGTGEITVMPIVQNSAGSGSSGGGGVVTITDNGDGTYSSSHTPAEIAAMAQTGAVVAVVNDFIYCNLFVSDEGAMIFAGSMPVEDEVGISILSYMLTVTNEGVTLAQTTTPIGEMHGADTENDGTGGTVPAPAAGQQDAVLHGDGTWRAALSENDKMELVTRVLEKLPTWEGGTY